MNPADTYEPEREGGDDMVAAEYVLGVLPAHERAAVARRIETDAEFARLVDAWEVRLAPMGSAYAEVEPPAELKAALDRRLFAADRQVARPTIWSSLAFWRGLTIAAVAALAVAVAVPLLSTGPVEQASPRLVASLADQGTDVHYFVVYDAAAGDIGLSHVTGARAEGRDFELWVIDEGAPVSLGIIPVGASVRLGVGEEMRRQIEAGAVFAISLEPEGGSPTGQPTGPVVASGDLHSV